MFGDLIDEIKEKSSYEISYERVAEYDHEQYLKTIENSTITIQHDLNVKLTDTDRKEVGNISTNIKVTVQVASMDLKSFIP